MFFKTRWKASSSVIGLLSRSSSQKHGSCHKAFLSAYMFALSLTTILKRTVLNLPMKEPSDFSSFCGIVHRSVSKAPHKHRVVLHKHSWQLVEIVAGVGLQSWTPIENCTCQIINDELTVAGSPLLKRVLPHCEAKGGHLSLGSVFTLYGGGEFWVWCLEWEWHLLFSSMTMSTYVDNLVGR